MRKVVLYARSAQLRAVIERAGELMASPDFRALKSEGRTVAGFLDAPGIGVTFIKRVDSPSWVRGIYDRVRGSRAARSLKGAAMLKARGIAHPEPLAAMDVIERGAVRTSYLLSQPLQHADSLSRFALGPGGVKGRDVRRRKLISDTVAREVRRLHDCGLYTRDLQETNIMVEDDGAGAFKVYFIDLEDVRRATAVSWNRRILNLVHLDRSIGRFLSRAARLDFLYSYLGERPARGEARKIVAQVVALRAQIDRRKRRTVSRPDPVATPAVGGT